MGPMPAIGRRLVALALAASLAAGGCASLGPHSVEALQRRGPRKEDPAEQSKTRARARRVLIGVVAAAAAFAVLGAVQGYRTQTSLEDDIAAGTVSGLEYTDRDATGERWNRVARASVFTAALAGVGLGLLWEMKKGDATLNGAKEPTPADDKTPIFPVTGLAPPRAIGMGGDRLP